MKSNEKQEAEALVKVILRDGVRNEREVLWDIPSCQSFPEVLSRDVSLIDVKTVSWEIR